jgi:hypothetical protein
MDGRGFYRIVVAVDFSPASEEAWDHARRLAALSDAELILTHVVAAAPGFVGGSLTRTRIAEVQASLRRWADDKLTKWTAGAVGPRTIMMGWSSGTSVAFGSRRGWGPDGRCTVWDPRTRVDDWPPPGAGESSCWSKS